VAVVASTGRTAEAKPVIVRVRFHRYGSALSLLSNGRYTFLGTSQQSGGVSVLRDEKTGSVMRIADNCQQATEFGGPWLLIQPCPEAPPAPATFDLYRLATGQKSVVTTPQSACNTYLGQTCTAVGVGAKWVEFVSECANCQPIDYVQRISDGTLRRAPSLPADEILDLNRIDLTRRLCSRVRVPRGGAVRLAGPFAVVTTSTNHLYLERCGHRSRTPISLFVGLNASTVLWTGPAGSLQPHLMGLDRQSGTRFLVRSRGVPGGSSFFLLSGPRLYTFGSADRVFVASAPRLN
jgi:hypothetical protein